MCWYTNKYAYVCKCADFYVLGNSYHISLYEEASTAENESHNLAVAKLFLIVGTFILNYASYIHAYVWTLLVRMTMAEAVSHVAIPVA